MVTAPSLAIHRLNKSFGALHVARDLELTLPVGARHALIGPNGAGKTTFINLVTGALSPTSGRIELAGRDVTPLSQSERSRRGLARTFQVNQLFRGLRVLDCVCLAVAERTGAARSWLKPLGWRSDVADEAITLLEHVGLVDEALREIRALPYGRQRLVEIVIALGQRPRVLLLDEPAAGVPTSEHRVILDVIHSLPEDLGLLIVEHDMEVVFQVARRITVLESGGILTEGTPEEIAADQDVRRVYLGEASRG